MKDNFPLPTKINIITKFAIKYGDKYYMTKVLFAFSEKNWFTDKISEIPDDMLFDSYNEANDCLLWICERHNLVEKYLSIDVVNKLKEDLIWVKNCKI